MSESNDNNHDFVHVDKPLTDGDVLTDPQALAKFQSNGFADRKQEALQAYLKLDKTVKRRVLALKKLQNESFKVEAEFFRRMNDLEREFEPKQAELYEQRRAIVSGEIEPTEEQCDWPDDDDVEGTEQANQAENTNSEADVAAESLSGIPNFWLTIFRNVQLLTDNKEDSDDAILEHLLDIKSSINPATAPRPGFVLSFYFSPNEYFTDSVLRKEYFIRFEPNQADPLSFEGPEVVECKGCPIHWKPGKNATVRTIKKTLRHKNRSEKKTVTKTVKTDSFFNFFDPPKGSLEAAQDDELDEELISDLQSDFELGQFLRESVLPRAVLMYTGEGIEMDDDEEDSDEDDEDDDDDAEDGEAASPARGLKGRSHRSRGNSNNSQTECKQQ